MTLTPEQLANSREEFEAILKSTGQLDELGDDIFEHCEHRFYKNRVTRLVFLGWKLRQESLVVELPIPEDMYDKGDIWIGRHFSADNVYSSISKAGINYREKE